MTLNLDAFRAVINNPGEDNKFLTVGEEAIKFGQKKGLATLGGLKALESDPLKTLKADHQSEDKTKVAAKNLFIRQQLLDLIRTNLPEECKRSKAQNEFFRTAEEKLFGAQDEKRNYISATGVEDLSIADAKELLEGLSKANKTACENAKKSAKIEVGENKITEEEIKLEDKFQDKGGNNNIIDIKHDKFNPSDLNPNVKILSNDGDDSYDENYGTDENHGTDENIVINEKIGDINTNTININTNTIANTNTITSSDNINNINSINNDKVQKQSDNKKDADNKSVEKQGPTSQQQIAIEGIKNKSFSKQLLDALKMTQEDAKNLSFKETKEFAGSAALQSVTLSDSKNKEHTVLIAADGTFISLKTFKENVAALPGVKNKYVKSLNFIDCKPMSGGLFFSCKVGGPGHETELVIKQDGSVGLKKDYNDLVDAISAKNIWDLFDKTDYIVNALRPSDWVLAKDFAVLLAEVEGKAFSQLGNINLFMSHFSGLSFSMMLECLSSNPAGKVKNTVDLLKAIWSRFKLDDGHNYPCPNRVKGASEIFFKAVQHKVYEDLASVVPGARAKWVWNALFSVNEKEAVSGGRTVMSEFLSPFLTSIMSLVGLPYDKRIKFLKEQGEYVPKFSDFMISPIVRVVAPNPSISEIAKTRAKGSEYRIAGKTIYKVGDTKYTAGQAIKDLEAEHYNEVQISQLTSYLNNTGCVLQPGLGLYSYGYDNIVDVQRRDEKTGEMRVFVRMPAIRPLRLSKLKPSDPLYAKFDERSQNFDVAFFDYTNEYVEHELIIHPDGNMKDVNVRVGRDMSKPAHTYYCQPNYETQVYLWNEKTKDGIPVEGLGKEPAKNGNTNNIKNDKTLKPSVTEKTSDINTNTIASSDNEIVIDEKTDDINTNTINVNTNTINTGSSNENIITEKTSDINTNTININTNTIANTDDINTNTITSSDNEIVINAKPSKKLSEREKADLVKGWTSIDSMEIDRVGELLKTVPGVTKEQDVAIKNINVFSASAGLVSALGKVKQKVANTLEVRNVEQHAVFPFLTVTLSAGKGGKEYKVYVSADGTFINPETFEKNVAAGLGVKAKDFKSLNLGNFEPMPGGAFAKCTVTDVNGPKEVVISWDGSVGLKTDYDDVQQILLQRNVLVPLSKMNLKASDLAVFKDLVTMINKDQATLLEQREELNVFDQEFQNFAIALLARGLSTAQTKAKQSAIDLLPVIWKNLGFTDRAPRNVAEFRSALRKRVREDFNSIISLKNVPLVEKFCFTAYGPDMTSLNLATNTGIRDRFVVKLLTSFMCFYTLPYDKRTSFLKKKFKPAPSDFMFSPLAGVPFTDKLSTLEYALGSLRGEGTEYVIDGKTFYRVGDEKYKSAKDAVDELNKKYSPEQVCQLIHYLNVTGILVMGGLGLYGSEEGARITVKSQDPITNEIRVCARMPVRRPLRCGTVDGSDPLDAGFDQKYKGMQVGILDCTNEYVEHEFIIYKDGSMKDVDFRFGVDASKPEHAHEYRYPTFEEKVEKKKK